MQCTKFDPYYTFNKFKCHKLEIRVIADLYNFLSQNIFNFSTDIISRALYNI